MTHEVVIRLYGALIDALRRRGHPEDEPVRVSELYEELVPYRAVRAALGVELNADYEHAVLRLLAGEGDLVRIEPDEAREELRQEADEPYPAVGLFRKFSASRAWVTFPPDDAVDHARARVEGAGDSPTDSPPDPPTEEARPGPRPFTEEVPDAGATAAPTEGSTLRLHTEPTDPEPAEPAAQGDACAFCGEALPRDRRVRFCPYCGGDQGLVPCPRCDAILERDWEYCISCGYDVGHR